MTIIEIIDKIIYLSDKINILLFISRDNKWKLKFNSLQLLKNHRHLLHENFCVRIKLLHESQQYIYSIEQLNLLQSKLRIIDNITLLLQEYYNINKKQQYIHYNTPIIESFSTNYN